MLDFMRKHAGTWMIKALLGAIVVVFVFWGVGSWTSHREGIVATVNGEPVSIEEYRSAYNRLLDQARQNFGAALSDDLVRSLQLEKSALDQLIDRVLLKQSAARMRLQVADEELAESIRAIPAFQSNGAFDRRRYQQVLSLNRMTPEAFEVSQRDAMLVEKLLRLVTDTVHVSDTEVTEWYAWNNAVVRFSFVSVDADRYKSLPLSDEEVAQYFERRKESYRTQPEVQVRYVSFTPEEFMASVSVSDQDIRDFYEANPERFVVPKTVEARHILIRVPEDAAPEAVEQARERILALQKQARDGADFAELAKAHSEDEGSKASGGALGAFRKEAMVQPFGEAAFALQAGQIGDPVRTRFGWHLIKVDKVNEGRTRSLEEASEEIRTQLKRDRARSLAYDAADAAYEAAVSANDLAGAAASRRLPVHTTDFFPRGGPVKGIPQSAQFARAAFDLAPGAISDVLELEDGYYLLQVAELRPARIPELAAVKDAVKADLTKEKQTELAEKDARALLQEAGGGTALEQAAKKLGLSLKRSDFVKRSDSRPDAGYEPEMVRAAFELSETKPLPAEPIRTSKGYAVVRFDERKAPSTEGLEKERDQLRDRLLQQKKFKTWEAWLDQLRRQAEIDRKKDLANI
jgi:peptidyl-prolyl cis-trans isomerase D